MQSSESDLRIVHVHVLSDLGYGVLLQHSQRQWALAGKCIVEHCAIGGQQDQTMRHTHTHQSGTEQLHLSPFPICFTGMLCACPASHLTLPKHVLRSSILYATPRGRPQPRKPRVTSAQARAEHQHVGQRRVATDRAREGNAAQTPGVRSRQWRELVPASRPDKILRRINTFSRI